MRTMYAPARISGQINASASGEVYQVGDGGQIEVDSRDVNDFLRMGCTFEPRAGAAVDIVAPVSTFAAPAAESAPASDPIPEPSAPTSEPAPAPAGDEDPA